MIRQDETDLTSEQYEAIKTNDGLFAAQTILEQRSLEFVLQADGQAGEGSLFDADRLSDGRIIKAYMNGTTLAASALADAPGAEWEDVGAIATGVTRIRPSIGGDYVFYLTGSGIYRRSLGTFPGGEAELIASSSQSPLQDKEVTHLAAADGSTVFVALYDQTNYTTNLQMLKLGGSWFNVNTEIYWPRRLTGLDAITLDDGAHLFVISSDLPPLIGQQVEGTTLRRVAERRNGLVAWRVQNWRSSDHYLVDIFDDASLYRYRKEPRLSKLADGRVVLTAYGSDGKADNSHSALHYYFSVDGRTWSHNHMFGGESTDGGAPMVVRGNYTYLIGSSVTYIAKGTSLTGNLHPDLVEDITSRINAYSSDWSGARQSTYSLRNVGWDTSSLIFKPVQLIIRTKLGVWKDNTRIMVPVSTEIVDVISPAREKPSENIIIQARDYTALLNGLIRSPHSREYDTQVLGADKYYDLTGTGYGGMAHTATALGSWSTASNWLILRSNNKRSVAFNTFKADAMWCGVIEGTVQIDPEPIIPPNPEDDEFGGFVFRAYDKDNYLALESVPFVGLRLSKYTNGKREVLRSWPHLGGGYSIPSYLRVVFRYSLVRFYYSVDGSNWNYFDEYIIPGQPPVEPDVADAPLYYEDGLVGFTGLGYSKDDVWPSLPDTPYIPPSQPGGQQWGAGTKSGIIALRLRKDRIGSPIYGLVAYTRAATTGPWQLLHGGFQPSSMSDGKPIEIKGMHLDPFDFGAAYLTFSNGDTYRNPDWRSGASWELVASALNLQTAFSNAIGKNYDWIEAMTVSMAANGHILLTAKVKGIDGAGGEGTGVLIRIRRLDNAIDVSPPMRLSTGYYTDSGLKWPYGLFGNRVPTLVAAVGEGSWGRESHGIWIADWTSTGSDWSSFTKFYDRGREWWKPRFELNNMPGQRGGQSVVSIPYTRLDKTPNENDLQIFWAGPGDRIWVSNNQGETFGTFTAGQISPRVPKGDARPDTWELNIENGQLLHIIRASDDVQTPDQLILSDNGGQSWRSVMLPTKGMCGWSGGFPGRDGQFYIGANRWPSWDYPGWHALPPSDTRFGTGRDMILAFTKDGGQTWNNWTHNLWSLAAGLPNLGLDNPSLTVGVVRMYPHPLER